MPLGGFFVYQQKLNFYILVFWGLLGTILGSLPWYYLGRLVNEKRLSNFLDKKGKYLGISSNDLNKSKRWFDKYGVSLVFWGRLVPGIRTLISVPAGIELMPLRKFLIWTTLGSLIWVALLTYAGYFFGENYPIIEIYLDQVKYFVKPFLVLIFAYTTRFLAVGNAALRSGILKVHPNAVDASQTMGKGFLNTIRVIVLPLIYTNILIGGILVFVDILKELPITLLLRPFNFETLATYVYQYASDELLQESSFAALIIIVVGLGPVIFLNSTLQRVSQKKESN